MSPGSRPGSNGGGQASSGSSSATAGEKGKGKGGDDKWVESVDYAYEYVPVKQNREGRKNM